MNRPGTWPSWRPHPGAEDPSRAGMSQLAACEAGLTGDPGCRVQPAQVYRDARLDPGSPERDPGLAAAVAREQPGPANTSKRRNRPRRHPGPGPMPNPSSRPDHDGRARARAGPVRPRRGPAGHERPEPVNRRNDTPREEGEKDMTGNETGNRQVTVTRYYGLHCTPEMALAELDADRAAAAGPQRRALPAAAEAQAEPEAEA